jgi:hypothetical protein
MNTNITQLLDLIAQIAPNKYLHYSGFRRAGRGDPHRYPQAVFECVNLDKAINFKEFFYYSAVANNYFCKTPLEFFNILKSLLIFLFEKSQLYQHCQF